MPVAVRRAPLRLTSVPPIVSWSAAWPKWPFESRSSAVVQLSGVAVTDEPYVPLAVFTFSVSELASSVRPGMPASDALVTLPSIAVHVALLPSVVAIDASANEPPLSWMLGPPETPSEPVTFESPRARSVAVAMSTVPSPLRSSATLLRVSTKSAWSDRKLPTERLRCPLSERIAEVSVTCAVEPPPVATSTGLGVNVEVPAL